MREVTNTVSHRAVEGEKQFRSAIKAAGLDCYCRSLPTEIILFYSVTSFVVVRLRMGARS